VIRWDRILAAYSGSPESRIALRRALDLAGRCGARLSIVSVGVPVLPAACFEWVPPYDGAYSLRQALLDALREAAEALDPGSLPSPSVCVGDPAAEIVAAAEREAADLVVVGCPRSPPAARRSGGSTADRLLRLSRVPVLIAAGSFSGRRILVAADDSPFGARAIECALSLAAATGGEVGCLHVADDSPSDAPSRFGPAAEDQLARLRQGFAAFVAEARRRALADARRGGCAPEIPLPRTTIRSGPVVAAILREAAAFRADLIVCGTHGRGCLRRALLGSVAEELVRSSDLSVLVVPGDPGAGGSERHAEHRAGGDAHHLLGRAPEEHPFGVGGAAGAPEDDPVDGELPRLPQDLRRRTPGHEDRLHLDPVDPVDPGGELLLPVLAEPVPEVVGLDPGEPGDVLEPLDLHHVEDEQRRSALARQFRRAAQRVPARVGEVHPDENPLGAARHAPRPATRVPLGPAGGARYGI
jgi:nucleotide-binding universal stress UspA family protein